MEQVVEVACVLREVHDFRGYIHLKTIPDASAELLQKAGRYADRLSINIELPTSEGLEALAPDKDDTAIRRSMARLAVHIADEKEAASDSAATSIVSMPKATPRRANASKFAPAGPSTLLTVGADVTDDAIILSTSANRYGAYSLHRVYYLAFSPILDVSFALPLKAPPMVREHRLYQADWLMRFYGFAHGEIVPTTQGGMLALGIDSKLAWALAHPERFPVDVNAAPRELLLRVSGLGVKAVDRLLIARQMRRLGSSDLSRRHMPLKKVTPFVVLADHRPARVQDVYRLAKQLRSAPVQATLFDA